MAKVFLSVGSNMGDRVALLREAVVRLRELPDVEFLDASPLYWTEPWERQPGQSRLSQESWFFNCVIAIETTLEPPDLLERMQDVERGLGRTRGPGTPEALRYEPRPLDIDILLYDDRVVSGPDHLHIPHLLMHERAFVLRPLADLAPELEHPVLYQTIRQLLDELADEHEVHRSDLPQRWFDL
jgi:2-amino-4-hydroxy-6-hydroxymethyldihydropteridine diphosphokinase